MDEHIYGYYLNSISYKKFCSQHDQHAQLKVNASMCNPKEKNHHV